VVRYEDEAHVFSDGTRMRFGRDDAVCEIPVWEQIRSTTMSAVAGELWCANGQMWVRNLSTAHELVVAGGGAPPQTLPARRPHERGHARSVPAPVGELSAPSTGGWRLVVESATAGRADHMPTATNSGTVRITDVPDDMRATAAALCMPLLLGAALPASHAEVGHALGITERAGRRRVDALCEHYREQVEVLPGGRRSGETLTGAVARLLVERGKVPVPPDMGGSAPGGAS
jgi:hypothetical protein